MRFHVDPEASPAARIVATMLYRASSGTRAGQLLRHVKGSLILRSTVDHQAVLVEFRRGEVIVPAAVPARADVTISTDLSGKDPDTKSKVRGMVRHPALALLAGLALEYKPKDWVADAHAFWAFVQSRPRPPRGMHVVSTDRADQLTLGDVGGVGDSSSVIVQGTHEALVKVFSGQTVLGDEVLNGRLEIVGTTGQVAVLSGDSLRWAMGEGQWTSVN